MYKRQGTPAYNPLDIQSLVTTLPLAITQPSPIVTPGLIIEPAPIQQPSPIVISLAITFPVLFFLSV